MSRQDDWFRIVGVLFSLMMAMASGADAGEGDPTQGSIAQAVGTYARGSLIEGSAFTDEGPGFVKVFRLRERRWATFDLIQVITRAASAISAYYPEGERLQLGDSSQHGGGLMSRHASHQNGLDVDVTYFNHAHRELDPLESEKGFQEDYVAKGKITANFDTERNWSFVKALASTGRINRIFMDPIIKKTFCTYARVTGEFNSHIEVLRHLRPLAGHAGHMHVRITCPLKSPECLTQAAPPTGSGCPAR